LKKAPKNNGMSLLLVRNEFVNLRFLTVGAGGKCRGSRRDSDYSRGSAGTMATSVGAAYESNGARLSLKEQ
jgi:hypothetical protein